MGLNITRISSVDYLQRTVMVGDRAPGTAMTGRGLTAYYTESGNPPGRWIGSGVAAFEVEAGKAIDAHDAVLVWQKFRNPSTHERLGKPPLSERKSSGRANDNQLAESGEQKRRDVAGFDLTFTIPKDASILWGIGDPALQARIAQCHERALAATLRQLETNILQSRAGHGGVATVAVKGLIAGQWDHWDTRDGEPHLHSHLVVSNRVQRASDGKWVTIDSRSLYRHAVMLSEVHQNLFLDEMHRELGIEWEQRENVASKAVVPDIVGMPEDVRRAFSSRAESIDRDLQGRVDAFRERLQREPTHAEKLSLKHDAWRATRAPKEKVVQPLSERCDEWRRLLQTRGHEPGDLVRACVDRDAAADLTGSTSTSVHEVLAALTADSLGDRQRPVDEPDADDRAAEDAERADLVAAGIIEELEGARSTWSAANIRAEAERVTRGVRASSAEVREAAIDAVTESVIARSVELSPQRYQVDVDDPRVGLHGRSIFDDLHRAQWTSSGTLDREAELLAALTTPGAALPMAPGDIDTLVQSVNARQVESRGFGLADDQAAAVREILAADTRLSVLIGPAGTGKTTTMSALRAAWTSVHGADSVIGLATSAQAAHVLGADIDTPTHTIAKWLYESTQGNARRAEQILDLQAHIARATPAGARQLRAHLARTIAQQDAWRLKPGQLVIVDEASMTTTPDLTALVRQADAVGARVLAVGDHRQLDAVGAGGALALLADSGPTSELNSVWRFTEQWEADASLELRHVRTEDDAAELVDEYLEHGRIVHGDDDAMLEASYSQTRDAIAGGRSAIIIAATNNVVSDINERFMHDRRLSGEVDATRTVRLRGDVDAGIGERILTRHNDRQLLDAAGDFIRNGTTAVVTEIRADGSIVAERDDSRASIVLPADYLSAHTQLGYATTAHRSQGVTVDEARLYLPTTDSVPSELLYVGMTRGRDLNQVYVGQESPPDDEDEMTGPGQLVAAPEAASWRGRLTGMMTTIGSEESATTVRARIADESMSLSRLVPEYEYLAAQEPGDEILDVVERVHGIDRTSAEETPVSTSLLAAWRAARASDPAAAREALSRPLTGLTEDDADADPTETSLRVLTGRLRALVPPSLQESPQRVHGLTARIVGVDEPVADLASQVETHIGSRISYLERAARQAPWAQGLTPDDIREVAIYRDLCDVRAATSPLGDPPSTMDTRRHAHFDVLTQRLASTPPSATTDARPSAPTAAPAHPAPARSPRRAAPAARRPRL